MKAKKFLLDSFKNNLSDVIGEKYDKTTVNGTAK